MHFNVTCELGGGGAETGSRMIWPEQDGQLSGRPVRSAAIKCSACAGLYVFGRGLRIPRYPRVMVADHGGPVGSGKVYHPGSPVQRLAQKNRNFKVTA